MKSKPSPAHIMDYGMDNAASGIIKPPGEAKSIKPHVFEDLWKGNHMSMNRILSP